MTEQTRKAIELLNKIKDTKAIEEDDYFFLLGMIIDRPQVELIPYTPYPSYPTSPSIDPIYHCPWRVTSTTTTENIYNAK